jgi:lysophospholipase L1-like esterase
MALDDMTGLAVDNIPLRGSQGLDFSKTDTAFFKQMVHTLNVGMIILHFGVNVAMNVVDDYSYYETAFYRELNLLKKLSDAPILVVGISDMMVDGGAMEMPNLEKIRAAQIRASGKAGCVFYDLYTAMGGRGSMKDWVASDPPLARSDYIHFSNEGANLVAQKMYEAIMAEYDLFELNQ